ncbi:GntR family transcriptional regulator [Kribbella aluminosa]|uniref:GntR family transcriptional regulator n=1 Tax=Kribbella aluminosa TaxID=416017 RepID=A0ABS4UXY0_9ACTN|nr:GntR family transcriptional regulator [Kribbella aluminosa]MBP2356504.1 GntR family transcriptional regulator [Kribbella aluminosa]
MMMSERAEQPKYEQVADEIARRAGELQAHDHLPSERDLMQQLDVSRMTVRRAIEQLVRRGLVYQVHGSGTFVADPDVVTKTLRLTSFTEDMQQRGLTPSTTVLGTAVQPATEDVARRLRIEPGADVLVLSRLRSADGTPMALESVHLPAMGTDWSTFDPTASLYAQMSAAGITVERAAQSIHAVNLDRDQAYHLDQAVGAAALQVTRVSYTEAGVPVEIAETIYRGDRYGYDVVINRAAQ